MFISFCSILCFKHLKNLILLHYVQELCYFMWSLGKKIFLSNPNYKSNISVSTAYWFRLYKKTEKCTNILFREHAKFEGYWWKKTSSLNEKKNSFKNTGLIEPCLLSLSSLLYSKKDKQRPWIMHVSHTLSEPVISACKQPQQRGRIPNFYQWLKKLNSHENQPKISFRNVTSPTRFRDWSL